MLIKEFCQATGLSRDTVRFYVKRGLLRPHVGARQSNRYQVFDAAQIERARLIKSAQRLGFSLKDIAGLAKAYEARGLTLERKAEALRAQLAEIDDRARVIRAVRGYLAAKLQWVEGGEVGDAPSMRRVLAPKAPARAADLPGTGVTRQGREANRW
jgi:MerR family copper efflux transcriptional regulator